MALQTEREIGERVAEVQGAILRGFRAVCNRLLALRTSK